MSAARFPMGVYWALLAVIALFAVAPIIVTAVAAGIANTNGCTINEGVLNPCVIDGVDHGASLQSAGLAALYVLATVPLALVFFIGWLIVLLIHRGRFKRGTLA
jgi:hypothetical protein